MLKFAGLLLALALAAAPAAAFQVDRPLADPAGEARAQALSRELRCLVCQNQSIDDSNADLARDLRVLVRERLTAGDSDDEVIDYVVSRYGDFVLLEPPFTARTLALWFGPVVIVALGLLVVFFFFRRRQTAPGGAGVTNTAPPPLTADEERRLKTLLEDDA